MGTMGTVNCTYIMWGKLHICLKLSTTSFRTLDGIFNNDKGNFLTTKVLMFSNSLSCYPIQKCRVCQNMHYCIVDTAVLFNVYMSHYVKVVHCSLHNNRMPTLTIVIVGGIILRRKKV